MNTKADTRATPLRTGLFATATVLVLATGLANPGFAQSVATPHSPKAWVADIKTYFTSPARWDTNDWTLVGGTLAAVAVSHQYDNRVRDHFDTRVTSHADHDSRSFDDALPAAAVVAGTWLYGRFAGNAESRNEAGNMFEAAVLSTATTFALKQVIGRERPWETADSGRWRDGGDSFPSLHATAGFAIGTVFAESGSDDHRWVRRVIGYGLAAGTAYARLDHGNHWLSDTVAGAALGIITARFVIRRHSPHKSAGSFTVQPLAGGLAFGYTVALGN